MPAQESQSAMKEFSSIIEAGMRENLKIKVLHVYHRILSFLWCNRSKFYDPDLSRLCSLKLKLEAPKIPGLCGLMRLSNEEETAEIVIGSVVENLDQLVVVINNSSDKTLSIAKDLQDKYKSKITLILYSPEVFKLGSDEHRKVPYFSPHSMANVLNFCLSKSRFTHAILIDGDDCHFGSFLSLSRKGILAASANSRYYSCFFGVNLWTSGQTLFINGAMPISGGIDHGIFPISKHTFFLKNRKYEKLVHNLKVQMNEFFYFHLKGIKLDRGFGTYSVASRKSYFQKHIKKYFTSPELWSWSHLREVIPVEYRDLADQGYALIAQKFNLTRS